MIPTTMPAKPLRKAISQLSRLACLLALGGSLALATTAGAHAQISNIFGSTMGPRLTQDDYDIGTTAALKLLNTTPAKAGRSESWSNPATGNSGKFTILSLYTMNNLPCRKVTSTVTYAASSGLAPRKTTLGVCQIPSGAWKTTP